MLLLANYYDGSEVSAEMGSDSKEVKSRLIVREVDPGMAFQDS